MSGRAAPATSRIPFAGGTLDPARWTYFENLTCLVSTPSSNDLAREVIDVYFAEDQALPPTVFAAEGEPRARGRNGREWKAPQGRGLYLTVLTKVGEKEPLSVVPIAVARWVREALKESCGVDARLKWPNDLYVGRRKLAGVLSEARTQGEDSYLAVGVGVNARGAAADVGVPAATTIEEEIGRPVEIAPLVQAVVDRIDAGLAHADWSREVGEWERVSAHRPGDTLRVRRNGEVVTGRYLGLDRSGFLRLETAEGETVVASGELEEW
ncbi:MAG TPA: biotin--[acetyl-CoA-carboxylase] ligase [Thermoanaerobaculia bacterium]|nr:biotin--[acetyl-CoA-carboxylase] ligase [Thermoanaerobaculia bacterium]